MGARLGDRLDHGRTLDSLELLQFVTERGMSRARQGYLFHGWSGTKQNRTDPNRNLPEVQATIAPPGNPLPAASGTPVTPRPD